MESHRENNFDVIRLIAASLVIISHSFGFVYGYIHQSDVLLVATGLDLKLPTAISLGTLGVNIFFVISGYLVAQSFLSRKSLKVYFTGRLLRIYPALIGVVLFSIFIVGPLCTNLSLKEYFTNTSTYKYLSNLTLMKLQYTLPGTFVRDAYQNGVVVGVKEDVVNSPLWTLVFEFAMYVVVAVYGVMGLLKKSTIGILFQSAILLVCSYYLLYPDRGNFFIAGFHVKAFSIFYIYFFSGVMMMYLKDKIRLNTFSLIGITIIWFLSFKTFAFPIATLIFTVYAIFYIAYFPKPIGKFITRKGDFSYGMYLYGFVISNIFVSFFGDRFEVWQIIIISLVLTIPFAVLSWFLIEKKALDFKKKFIQRFSGAKLTVTE